MNACSMRMQAVFKKMFNASLFKNVKERIQENANASMRTE